MDWFIQVAHNLFWMTHLVWVALLTHSRGKLWENSGVCVCVRVCVCVCEREKVYMCACMCLLTLWVFCEKISMFFLLKLLTSCFVKYKIVSKRAKTYTDIWMESLPVKHLPDFSKLNQQGGIFPWQRQTHPTDLLPIFLEVFMGHKPW